MQQIPRESYIRDCFVAKAGHELVVMDVNAMELRVACCEPIADEKQMQQAFRDGVDPHIRTASLMFGVDEESVDKTMRQQAKATNFGAVYGSGAGGLKDYFTGLGISLTLQEATEFLRRWKSAYPGFASWHQWCARMADTGEVRMVDGRRRWLVGEMARPTVYANNQTQGTSASIVKQTMVQIQPRLPEKARLIAQIHDELIVETPEGTGEEVLEMMKNQLLLAGRLVIGDSVDMIGSGSVARSWGAAK